jgi:inner membrane protein
MRLHFFPRNEYLLRNVSDHAALQNLKRFSKGFYTVSLQTDTLVFNDLRFGQIAGWQHAGAPFVFHYFLQHSGNTLVVQRGRFAGWSRESIAALLQRIRGDRLFRITR